jgi:hypothetical protein
MTHERPPLTEPDQDPEELTNEEIDEQGADSFPASDPPSYSSTTRVGDPAREDDLDEERREREEALEQDRRPSPN